MHWIVGAVLHATVLGIISFFILFAASKAEGFTAVLGKLLGSWVLLLAVLGLACGIYFGVTGKGPMGGPGWMHHWGPPPGPMMQPPPPPATTPAPPATTPAPKKP
jgi:hypothetical protein